MTLKSALFATALTTAALLAAPALATTLVTSLAAFQAGTTGTITNSANPGSYDLTQYTLPTTTTIRLNDGATLGLSNTAQVTAPLNGFPYRLSDGFTGELFLPLDGSGNQVSSETITLSSGITALGFEIAPFSNAAGAPYVGFAGGPFNVTFTLASGQTQTVSLPGGSFSTATTASQFFGFLGGGISALTISTTDPNGLGFGNFFSVNVPEPASATLLLVGMAGLLGRARRRAAIA